MTVMVYTPTTAVVLYENLTQGQTLGKYITFPSNTPLCQKDAAWLVEAPTESKEETLAQGFANFGQIDFTDASAILENKNKLGPNQGLILEPTDPLDGSVKTSVQAGSDRLTVKYVGA